MESLPQVYGIDKVLIYGAKYVDKMFKKVETGFWKDFLLALQKLHQQCSPASFEEFRLAPVWYNNMGNRGSITRGWKEEVSCTSE